MHSFKNHGEILSYKNEIVIMKWFVLFADLLMKKKPLINIFQSDSSFAALMRRKKRTTTHPGQRRLKEGRIISDKQTNDDIHSRMISYELLMIRARQTELMENGSLNLKFCG